MFIKNQKKYVLAYSGCYAIMLPLPSLYMCMCVCVLSGVLFLFHPTYLFTMRFSSLQTKIEIEYEIYNTTLVVTFALLLMLIVWRPFGEKKAMSTRHSGEMTA